MEAGRSSNAFFPMVLMSGEGSNETILLVYVSQSYRDAL